MSTTMDPVSEKKPKRRKKQLKKSADAKHELRPATPAEATAPAPDLSPSAASRKGACWLPAASPKVRDEGISPAEQWKRYFKRRPGKNKSGVLSKSSALRWAWTRSVPTECAALFARLETKPSAVKRARKTDPPTPSLDTQLADWMAWARGDRNRLDLGVSALAAAHVIAAYGGQLEPGVGWQLLDFLWQTAVDARPWATDVNAAPESALAQQLLAGELPLTLSLLFAEMAPMRELRSAASSRLTEGLLELLNGDGLVRGQHLAMMRPLAACWTRCAAIAGKKSPWLAEARKQFQLAVRQVVRWTAPTGKQFLGPVDEAKAAKDFLQAALAVSGDERAASAANRLKLGGKGRKKIAAPADNSDWSSLAVLRTDWSPKATTLAVDYSSDAVQLELWTAGQQIARGEWSVDAHVDGQVLAPAGPWEEVCWVSDRDVDYIEWTQALTNGARLDRQIMLARRENILFLCDHLRAAGAGNVEHAWNLPLAAGVEVAPESETRDALLKFGKRTARVIPVGLAEWRIDPRFGELEASDGALRLRQRGHGRTLACPLVIDLDPKRSRKEATWRQLCVAEELAIQGSDVAVAYRIQCGRDQWVVYRSQGERGNRTFIGQNTAFEFVAARFIAAKGTIKELIEIEG